MYPPITYSLLESIKTCNPQLGLIEKHFGKTNSIPLTTEIAIKFGGIFDINWAADHLLTPEDLEEFRKVRTTARKEYEKIKISAWAEFEKGDAPETDWIEYEKVSWTAWDEYAKARALAFVEIYAKGMK